MKKQLLYFFCGIVVTYSYAQQERAEVVLMDCAYNAFTDNGKAFKQVLLDYEQLLIDEDFLIDRTGHSYIKAFEKLIHEDFKTSPSVLFNEFGKDLEVPDGSKRRKCTEEIIKDSINYDFSKLKAFQKATSNLADDSVEASVIGEGVLSVLTAEDFELEFYKLTTFVVFQIFDMNSGIARKLPEIEDESQYTEEELKKALKISLNKNSEVLIGDTQVDLKDIRPRVIEYLRDNTSEAIISISNERETSYATYIAVQNEIVAAFNFVRNELSQKQYNTSFDLLTEEQAQTIKAIYPKKISEVIN